MAEAPDCGAAGFARDDGGAEFWNQPDGYRAELIDGILYDMTPPGTAHQRLLRDLLMQLGSFIRETGGPCEVFSAPFAVRVTPDDRNWFEPDLTVVCDPSKISERGCEAAPDLVVEIVSPSTQRRDYITKTARYEEGGVREYWIVDPAAGHTTVWRFDAESVAPRVYAFGDSVPVGIWDGACEVRIGERG